MPPTKTPVKPPYRKLKGGWSEFIINSCGTTVIDLGHRGTFEIKHTPPLDPPPQAPITIGPLESDPLINLVNGFGSSDPNYWSPYWGWKTGKDVPLSEQPPNLAVLDSNWHIGSSLSNFDPMHFRFDDIFPSPIINPNDLHRFETRDDIVLKEQLKIPDPPKTIITVSIGPAKDRPGTSSSSVAPFNTQPKPKPAIKAKGKRTTSVYSSSTVVKPKPNPKAKNNNKKTPSGDPSSTFKSTPKSKKHTTPSVDPSSTFKSTSKPKKLTTPPVDSISTVKTVPEPKTPITSADSGNATKKTNPKRQRTPSIDSNSTVDQIKSGPKPKKAKTPFIDFTVEAANFPPSIDSDSNSQVTSEFQTGGAQQLTSFVGLSYMLQQQMVPKPKGKPNQGFFTNLPKIAPKPNPNQTDQNTSSKPKGKKQQALSNCQPRIGPKGNRKQQPISLADLNSTVTELKPKPTPSSKAKKIKTPLTVVAAEVGKFDPKPPSLPFGTTPEPLKMNLTQPRGKQKQMLSPVSNSPTVAEGQAKSEAKAKGKQKRTVSTGSDFEGKAKPVPKPKGKKKKQETVSTGSKAGTQTAIETESKAQEQQQEISTTTESNCTTLTLSLPNPQGVEQLLQPLIISPGATGGPGILQAQNSAGEIQQFTMVGIPDENGIIIHCLVPLILEP